MRNCLDYCAGRLRGIVENGKLMGELPKDFELEVIPIKVVRRVPAGAYIMTCEHRRNFLVRPTKETLRKYPDERRTH